MVKGVDRRSGGEELGERAYVKYRRREGTGSSRKRPGSTQGTGCGRVCGSIALIPRRAKALRRVPQVRPGRHSE